MRVLALTRYGRLGASSRVRFYQYFPALEAQGIHCEARPLFEDEYLVDKYAGRGTSLAFLARAVRRRVSACLERGADVAWIEYELLPWCPPGLEQRLAGRLPPFVVEYDDAVFHRYDMRASRLVRRLFGRKIARMMTGAAAVVAGNGYLADYARRAGARRVVEVPSTVDVSRFGPPAREPSTRDVIVGWIGSPSTARYLSHLAPVAERLRARGLRLVLVGAGEAAPAGLASESWAWDERREPEHLASMDIGIMPLDDGPWERGKCGYKLIQYMAASLPVVSSPVGANLSIVEDGRTGLFASSPGEWAAALERLAADPGLRRSLGRAGRERAERHYSVEVQSRVLAGVLHDVAQA